MLSMSNVRITKNGTLHPYEVQKPMEIGPLLLKSDGDFTLSLSPNPKPKVEQKESFVFVSQKDSVTGEGVVLIIMGTLIIAATENSTDRFELVELVSPPVWRWVNHSDEVNMKFWSLENADDFMRQFHS